MPRLLLCQDCRTVEPLPDPPKNVNPVKIEEGQDPLLDELLKKHRYPNGEAHYGSMVTVEEKDWSNRQVREAIIKEINDASRTTGIGDDMYSFRDSFHEDAMRCYNAHRRPQDGCIDWRDDSKILGRPTKEGREYAKANYKSPMKTYLCSFCPVASTVMTNVRASRGEYKK